MSARYDKLIPALKQLLEEEKLTALGRAVMFIRRLRQIRASAFVWSVVLSRFGNGQPAFEQARQWYARLAAGATLWPRPFQVRFKTAAAVRLFEEAFASATQQWRGGARRARHPLSRYFPDIAVVDSTVVQVSDELRQVYKGTRQAKALLKTLLTISLFGLVPLHAKVVAGNVHDMKLFPELGLFRQGTLLLFDKGFVAYGRLQAIMDASLHFVCRMREKGNATIVGIRRAPKYVRNALKRSPDGVRLRDVLGMEKRIGKAWDLDVVVASRGKKVQTRCRLVIVPGPTQAQRPYLTNLPPTQWQPKALVEAYRLRWQIELVFKELKQDLNLRALNTKDRHAVQVFTWASLIALALSRVVTACFCPPTKITGLASPFRPALMTRTLRSAIRLLAHALLNPKATDLLAIFADAVQLEVRSRNQARADSFTRLPKALAA